LSIGLKTVIIIIKEWTNKFRDKIHLEGTQSYVRFEFKKLHKNAITDDKNENNTIH
jgi:hypothetical protein